MTLFGKKQEEEMTQRAEGTERTEMAQRTRVAPAPPETNARPPDTVFGKNLKIQGTVTGDGDITILGSFEGEFDLKGKLTIADQASITGNLKASVISVNGTVKGTLKALDSLRLDQTARVNGQIITPRICITEGALIDGEVKMSSKLDARPRPAVLAVNPAPQPPEKPPVAEKAQS